MENIVTYLDENFIHYLAESIQKEVDNFYSQPDELADFILGIRKATDELGRKLVECVLNGLDEQFCKSEKRTREMEIKSHVTRKLLTSMGEIRFRHTLFHSKADRSPRYLLDEMIGLDPNQKMTDDAVAALLEEAVFTSYEKAGHQVSTTDRVSRQTVKNKIHELRFPPLVRPKIKRKVPFLYIEADEDHVALQFLARKGDIPRDENGRKSNCAISKIVYVHEGLEKDGPKSHRRHLIRPHYFGGIYAGDDNQKLWNEVFQYICDTYEIESIKKIFLGADGGAWIKGAKETIPGLLAVLDEFHLSKYLLKITAFLGDSAVDARSDLKEAIREDNREDFDRQIEKILSYCETESGKKRITESADYIHNNWDAALLRLRREEGIVGCSAEGHVSHVLSARMSSRPMGWSMTGVDRMSRLRIYLKNGGDMLELAKYQRISVEKELPAAAGAEGLSCHAILQSEKNHHPQLGKYVEAVAGRVCAEITKQQWFKGLQNCGLMR